MLTYTLEKGRGQSLYESLYQKIRADIVDGNLKAGDKLPSKRALAANLGISVVTVESAYAQLVAEGYAEARPRRGVFVCAIGRQLPCPAAQPEPPEPSKPAPVLLDLSGGGGEDVPFPFSVWAKTLREVIATQGKRLMEPVPFGGAPELRQAIAAHLYQTRGLRVSPEQIVVGAGNRVFLWSYRPIAGPGPTLCRGGPGLPENRRHLPGQRRDCLPGGAGPGGALRPRSAPKRGANRPHLPGPSLSYGNRHAHPAAERAAGLGLRAAGALYPGG